HMHRKLPFPAILLAGLVLGSAFGQDPKPAATPDELGAIPHSALRIPHSEAELQERLAGLLSEPRFEAAQWGVKIVSLDTGKTLFEQNPGKLFSPASNAKLYTVALALDRLGPDYRIRTSLYAKTRPDPGGTLEGDVVVYGRGDPTINARLHGGDSLKALEPLAAALTNAGVKRIAGDLIGDASFFRGPEFGSGWAWDDQEHDYGAEISSLTINNNTLGVLVRPGERVGAPCRLTLMPATGYLALSNRTETVPKGQRRAVSLYRLPNENVVYAFGQTPLEDPGSAEEVTLHNPAGLFIAFFGEALARHGITVSGRLRTLNWLDRQADPLYCSRMVELGALESPLLRDLAREVLKPSQNLYADLLLAHLGESQRTAATPAGRTSEDLGISQLDAFLAQAGVKGGEVFFNEGSGLSRENLTTPNATVALLRFMSRHPCGKIFLEALPIAGVDGTLKGRMRNTPAAGKVRAKTGSLRWATSLSGYVTTAAGERLAFCLMLNRYHSADPARPARAEVDAIAVMLAGLTARSQ
ncbi:MAG TPA: D-alanyl-D-alanine carboxypeptidase/D-alanyl-D-alanine-endopeptidase, partial [Dongiaceae bacterium]|nr:D-alanyl-D-alanine carboxypeptidase/D-alanyl-D-alanine-endopeptidase [Dongiaceae bacterium]